MSWTIRSSRAAGATPVGRRGRHPIAEHPPRATSIPSAVLAGVLAAVVLALALPALAAAQGWIEPPHPGGPRVERVDSRVRVIVDGPVAHVEVDEWFENRGWGLAEGHYLYPLPADVALSGVSLFQGEEELRGEVMDAARAREIYEEIVRRRKDPALVEYLGDGLFRSRVFPIGPGETRRVTLRYAQVLPSAGGSLHYRFVGAERAVTPVRVDGRRPGEASHTPAPAPLDFELRATPAESYLEPFSPTHALESRRRGDTLVVRAREVPSGRMSVFLPRSGGAAGLTVLTHRPAGEDGFVLLSVTPPASPGHREPRDLVVVVDVSGSMQGTKLEQARGAVRGILEGLGPDDRFRLIAFSNSVLPQDAGWTRATPAARAEGRAWADALRADGGTNLDGALQEALRVPPDAERLPVVLFLTDGLPTVGEQDAGRIADAAEARRGRFRIFAFGVGHDVNTRLLDRVSAATRGTTQYVEPGEDVERAVSLLAQRIHHPVLTDLELAGTPVTIDEIYPVRIPDVFAGESLVLLGRYRGQGAGDVVLTGRQGGRAERVSQRVTFPGLESGNEALPRLWAARKIGHLTRQLWIEGESPALVEEIRATALRYGLPSPFTSILVEEPGVLASGEARDDAGRLVGMEQAVAAAPIGATAVKAAEGARLFREAERSEDLDALADDVAADGTAVVGSRVFRLLEGVWTERGTGATLREVRVQRFSGAWFRLVEALPEIATAARRFEAVVLEGRAVRLRLDERGIEHWPAGELERLVAEFRPSS
jgi:Ca-activated chloride channel family protein